VPEYRVWAYAVLPARTTAIEDVLVPHGGSVSASEDLRAALQAAGEQTKEGSWTSVVFRTEQLDDDRGRRRSNAARDALLDLAFAGNDVADIAAFSLATRLGLAMDKRSPANLLVMVASRTGDIGSTRVWTFPRDDAFRFDESVEPTIELLADVFSRTSGLRKAAKFDGQQHDASFVGGHALDFQTGSNSFEIATYWIVRFLDCRLGVTPTAGTQLVARAMKKLDARLTDPSDRQNLTMAAMAVGHSPRTNWSLSDIAASFLPEALASQLIDSSDQPQMNAAPFALDKGLFDTLVATRVFSLDNGVVVASPIGQVGDPDNPDKPVVVTGDHLRCEGVIARETLRGQRRAQIA
jgi:hypothetical protein